MFRVLRNIFAVVGLLAILASACVVVFQVVLPSWYGRETEIHRLPSPGREYDAVVTTQEPGAFGSSMVRLYVVPAGVTFGQGSRYYKFEALRSHTIRVDGLKWRDDRTLLVVRGLQDHIYEFNPVQYDLRDIVANRPEPDWRRVTLVIQTDERL